MSTGAQYVVAAYAVILFVLLMYVLVLGARTQRIAREVEVLARVAREAPAPPATEAPAERVAGPAG
jgi:CcmD family protein